MTDKLTGLAKHSVIVADSGEIDKLRALGAQDCTTNPSLILRAASQPQYAPLIEKAVAWAKAHESDPARRNDLLIDKLAVTFGSELTRIVPGYVSTEVDARLSFDSAATIARAERIVGLYREAGVDTSRILIKVAATWEGVQAAAELTRRGIKCNLTLIFSLAQAVACAEAGVFLISPFVGRITDWYKAHGTVVATPEEDPGVCSVREIYSYYKSFGYKTVVMGASFRNIGQILSLAGCDRLTISPALIEELRAAQGDVPRALVAGGPAPEKLVLDEPRFRWRMNDDAMACEKLAEGIRQFARDTEKLIALVGPKED